LESEIKTDKYSDVDAEHVEIGGVLMPGEVPRTVTRVSEPFVVMAKPVGPVCNLECSYCYYLETARLYTNPHKFRMSDALLETYVRQYIEASPGPTVLFEWHGGTSSR